MKRTLGTISTEKGIARIEHDSETKELIGVFADGSIEPISDYYPTQSWRKARKQVIAMYGGQSNAYHDFWVLCLRSVRQLERCKSESAAALAAAVAEAPDEMLGAN